MQPTGSDKLRKAILLDESMRAPAPKLRAEKTLLPPLRFLSALEGDFDGAFVLEDGGVRQIFECCSIMPLFDPELCAQVEATLVDLLRTTSCDLQFVVQNGAFDASSHEKQFLPIRVGSRSEYYDWYVNYYLKWFAKVAAADHIATRKFYVVVTDRGHYPFAPPSPKSGLSVQRGSKLTSFIDRVSMVIDALADCHLQPRALGEAEALHVLMSHMHQEGVNPVEPSFSLQSESGVTIGSHYHTSRAMLMPPRLGWFGMLTGLMSVAVPYTVSVHLRNCPQAPVQRSIRAIKASERSPEVAAILAGTEKALQLSVYFSTYGKDRKNALTQMSQLKGFFTDLKYGSNFLQTTSTPSRGSQLQMWRSSLPLGDDECRVAKIVPAEFAATFFPLFSETNNGLENIDGFFLGSSIGSREACFVDTELSNSVMVSAPDAEETAKFTTFLTLHFWSAGANCLTIGSSSTLKFLATLFGDKLVKGASESKISTLTVVDVGENELSMQDFARLETAIENWSKVNERVLCIEDLSVFTRAGVGGIELVKRLCESAEGGAIRVVLGVSHQDLENDTFNALERHFTHKILVPGAGADWEREAVCDAFGVDSVWTKSDSGVRHAISICDEKIARVEIFWSPVDQWILLHDPQMKVKIDGKKRQKVIKEFLKEHPKLAAADAYRHAVYYLANTEPHL